MFRKTKIRRFTESGKLLALRQLTSCTSVVICASYAAVSNLLRHYVEFHRAERTSNRSGNEALNQAL
jgi:hypothetical protein